MRDICPFWQNQGVGLGAAGTSLFRTELAWSRHRRNHHSLAFQKLATAATLARLKQPLSTQNGIF